MPLLIGPPSALLGGTLGFPWLGLIVALGGTFVVVRDVLKIRSVSKWNTPQAAGLALVFCALWFAVAAGLVWGISSLFEDDYVKYEGAD